MSRKLKYGEPTKTVGFKVPLSKVDEFKDLGNEKLNEYTTLLTTAGHELKVKGIKYINFKKCGCTIENGLLKRAKNSKCKLTKSEHVNF